MDAGYCGRTILPMPRAWGLDLLADPMNLVGMEGEPAGGRTSGSCDLLVVGVGRSDTAAGGKPKSALNCDDCR